MTIVTLEEALADARDRVDRTPHLLLGNGFSIDCRPDAFSYGRLFDQADFSGLSIDHTELFGLCGTSDFEQVIEMLRRSAAVLDLYQSGDASLRARIAEDAERVKSALAEVLARHHPDRVDSITDAEYTRARGFLSRFQKIYTVNYDLLLYWSMLRSELPPPLESDDGFRGDPDDPDAEYVVWDPYNAPSQRVSHLHGGLHLFDVGPQIKKLTWARTGVPLIDQIRAALDDGLYPRVVTEGSSQEKLEAITHSAYLHKALRSLSSLGGALFMHGISIADNDEHIVRAVVENRCTVLKVSLHGDPESNANQEIRRRAEAIAARRPERKALDVGFYDASSAHVWR